MRPRILLLGGVDPSGGAGITLDATVVASHGGQPLPVAVVLTAQNRRGFRAAHPVAESDWRAAFDSACDDGPIHAVKVGLLGDAATVAAIAAALRTLASDVPVLVDPVLSATAGGFEAGDKLRAAYREHLAPLATLLTPNLPELAELFDGEAGNALRLGARAVLVKGGHGVGDTVTDVLVTAAQEHRLVRPRLAVGAVRGTGCALASAIAVRLSRGQDLVAACRTAGDWLAARLAKLGPLPDRGLPSDGLPRTLPFDEA